MRFSISAPKFLVVLGSCLFLFALWLSAYLDPSIGWLHFFQAWMYFATIALCLRNNAWGYFIGGSAAALWDYINVFVTSFFRSGLHWAAISLSTGHLQRVDQMVALPAWIGNFLIIVGSVWGYIQLREKHRGDAFRLLAAFALTTAFFAGAIALCQPRYLPLFPAILHPRKPW